MSTTPERSGGVDTILLVRLAAASVLLAVSLVLELSELLRTVLLAAAVVAAGYDIALKAVHSVQRKDFFAAPVVVLFVTAAALISGFFAETAAMVVLYQLGSALVAYSQERLQQSVLSNIGKSRTEIYEHMSAMIGDHEGALTAVASSLESAAGAVLRFGVVIAVLFAVLVPLMTGLTYRVSIHRALVMILVCNTGSVVASLSCVALTGMCSCAGKGIITERAEALEALADTEVAVFDKSGVFTDSSPEVVAVEPVRLDRDTFITFAAHAAYYSEQPFAQAVADLYGKDYKLELIGDFVDIAGAGVELSIGGAHVVFGKRILFAGREEELPPDSAGTGQVYYMTVAGKYVGRINVSSGMNPASENLVSDFRDEGVEKLVLLTEEGREESTVFAEEMRFTGLFSQCDTAAKLKCIRDIRSTASGNVVYIYANGVQMHTDADVDIRVSGRSKYADILVLPEYVDELPSALETAKKIKSISAINALITFAVKAVVITLALTGYCNLWLAVLLDSAAAVAAVFNSDKVSAGSHASVYKRKK